MVVTRQTQSSDSAQREFVVTYTHGQRRRYGDRGIPSVYLWLTWLKPLSLQMWSIGHQRTVSTSRDPVLLLPVNPVWRRPASSFARLHFSRCSVVSCLPLSLRVPLESSSYDVDSCFLNECPIHVHLILLRRTSADSWSVAFRNSTFLILSYHLFYKNPTQYEKQQPNLARWSI